MRNANAAAFALLRRVAEKVDVRHHAGEATLVAAFEAAGDSVLSEFQAP